jgi:hypothetical protein
MKLDPRNTSSQRPERAHGPSSQNPNRYPLLSLPRMTGGTHLSARSSPTVSPPSPVTSPELLPRHHRDLIVHQDPSIKSPDTPSLVSLFLFTRDAARTAEFAIGVPPICGHHRRNSSPPVNLVSLCLSYPPCFPPELPLTFLFLYFIANRAQPRRPKLTAANSRSSRAFTPQQEAIGIPDHTIIIASSSCSPSEISPVRETTGARRRSTTSAPRRT